MFPFAVNFVCTYWKAPALINDRLLTVKEVCELVHISRSHLGDITKQGRLAMVKFGARSVRYRASDIAAFLAANTKGACAHAE